MLPSRIAYHVVYDSSLEDALHYASENGWTGIVPDISVPRLSPEKYSRKDRELLRETSDSLSLEWGFHAPGDDLSLFTTYPPVKEAIITYFKQIIDFARDLSTSNTNVVVHAGVPPTFRKVGTVHQDFLIERWDIYYNTLLESLLQLVEYGIPDVAIALENYYWTEIVRGVVDEIVPKGLKLCLDVPKLCDSSLSLIEPDWELFRRHQDAVEAVHVHDWKQGLGSHQVVGTGDIDFCPFFEFLLGINKSIQYVIEVRPREAATESLSGLRKVLKECGLDLSAR